MRAGHPFRKAFAITFALCLFAAVGLSAEVPEEISWQGYVAVDGSPFDGSGSFKFAIVNNTSPIQTLWSNDGASTAGSEPIGAVLLAVNAGVVSVRLGDTSHPNMAALPATVFENADTWLKVWFGDGSNGFQELGPKQKIASAPYAMIAQTVPDNSISGRKLQRESVWPEHAGRSNTVVSYCTALDTNTTQTIAGSVPEGKTYVITDLVFAWDSQAADKACNVLIQYGEPPEATTVFAGGVRYEKNGTDYFAAVEPTVISFRAGLPIPGGKQIRVLAPYLAVDAKKMVRNLNITLSGYEFGSD